MLLCSRAVFRRSFSLPNDRLSAWRVGPTPGISKPKMRQQMKRGRVRPAIENLYAYANIFRRFFSVLNENIEVAIVVKDARIEQLKLSPRAASTAFLDQPVIRILTLRIFVEHPHIAVRRSVVQMEPILLHIFAVIPLIRREPKHALFQNRIAAIPKRQRKHQQLIAVADSRDAIVAPAISLAASVIVWQKIPSIAVSAVILANSSPGAIANIRPPLLPRRHRTAADFGEPRMFLGSGGIGWGVFTSVHTIALSPESASKLSLSS